MLRHLAILLLSAVCAPAQAVTVPLILEGNAPIIELEVVGPSGAARKARFLVDTGGGSLILGSKLMADAGAQANGPAMKEEGDLIQALKPPAVRLGGMDLDLSGVRVFGMPEQPRPLSRNDAEGLFPASLLRHYRVVFDYTAGKFTLAKPGSVKPQGEKIGTPISRNGFPRIEIQVAGKSYGFLLDTGASFTMISRTVLEEWTKQNPAWHAATGAVGFANMSGNKNESDALMLRCPEWKAGPFVIKDPAAVSRPAGTFEKWMSGMMTAPIVGSVAGNVLRDFRVEIDYENGVTYLEKSGNSSDADLVTAGLVLGARADGALVVAGISSGAAADVKSSVRAGDYLIEVDGVGVTGKPLAAAALALQGKADVPKRLKLKRGEEYLTVTVTPKSII
ncbi:MAG TPA: aspartyl protease family protein [Bryobacteraceae bacterium]